MDGSLLDDIIRRLVETKNGRTTKQVHLTEAEIKQLCLASKEVFLSQPNLLELEAPIKICGKEMEKPAILSPPQFFISVVLYIVNLNLFM